MARDGFSSDAPGLLVEERAVRFMTLRLHRPAPAILGDMAHAFGKAWPMRSNTAAGVEPTIAWIGPAEWAIFDAPTDVADLVTAAAGSCLHHLCDLSAGVRAWRVEGRRAREVLASGTGLDVHPRAFPPGACTRMRLADITVLVLAVGPDAFDLVADVSLAAHLRGWLQDAAENSVQ